jgi:PPOX class probable F420-dependent enzyme
VPDLDDVRDFLADDHGLAVVSTSQADGRVLSSVVNCGVTEHPLTGEPTVALVSRGSAARLGHVRRGAEVTVAVQRGWRWIGVTGPCDVIGPDDPNDQVDADRYRLLMRELFQAAGGTHDDYDEYDRAMAEERRACMFVAPQRIIGQA